VPASREAAKAAGVAIAAKAADAVKDAAVVITMLPAGKHVLSSGTKSSRRSARRVDDDCSTIDVESARQSHALAAAQHLPSIDGAGFGGTGGAKGATLTFMAGGDATPLPRQSRSSRRWARRWCIAARPGGAGGQDLHNMILASP